MSRFPGRMGRVALPGILAVLLGGPAAGQGPAEDWRATGDEIVTLVRERFFDRSRAEAWVAENAGYAAGVRDRAEFIAATRAALARLRASHTAYYTPDDPRYYGLISIFHQHLGREAAVESIGVDVAPGNFVRVVFAGSPAEAAGLQRGDQILRADGREFEPVASFRGRAGQGVTLAVQSRRNEPPRDVVVAPRRIDPKQEWLAAQQAGAQVVAVGGKQVAYMPFFSAAGTEHLDLLRAAIVDQFAAADALVLDFRHGWGGASPEFLSLFSRLPPVFDQIGRDGERTRYDPQWRKPLVILTNEGTTSGKEMVAFAVKRHRLGTLVGQRTAGAVLAGTPFLLRDGSLVYLAVADVRVDGERIEGVGVAPDVEVPDDLPFAAGNDPQLARALAVAGAAS